MKRKLLPGLMVALFAASPALAFDPFVVKDIRVEGIQRTEAGTVFNYLPVRVGETFSEAQAADAIRALFATGFFSDVRIETEGDVIVVVVNERAAIADITFDGVKEFDKDALKKGLREVGLAESRIFDRSLLERAEQELKRQYLSRGKYRGHGHHDRDAARAQPRRHQLQGGRRRRGQDPPDPHRRREDLRGGRPSRRDAVRPRPAG